MYFAKEVLFVKYPLCLVGLWPENQSYDKTKFTFSVILAAIGLIVNIRPLFFANISATYFMENMSYSLSYVLVLTKLYIMKKNKARISVILKWMSENWNHYHYLPEKWQIVMYQQIAKTRNFVIAIYGILGLTLISLIVGSEVEVFINHTSTAKISKEGWYAFQVETPLIIAVIFIVRALSSTFGGIIWSGVDCCTVLLVNHVCAQMNILCNMINDYKESTSHININPQYNNNRSYYCCCLKCIIHRHNTFFEISKAIENYVNMIIFMKLIIQGAQISTIGFTLMTNKETIFSIVGTHVSFFLSILWTTFIYGWLGEQITQHSIAIGDAVYFIPWYEFREAKIRQTMMMIICRANKPFVITGGKCIIMSLNTVSQAIVTCISYLSVLYAVKSSSLK